MATFSAVTHRHVLAAIAEYDDRGEANFLGVYGYDPSPRETLTHDGRTYDARALLGVAHKHATGRAATPEEIGRDRVDPLAVLRKCGFEASEPAPTAVAEPVGGRRAATTRTAAARSTAPKAVTKAAAPRARTPKRRVVEDTPPAICPTCFMTLPATGVCDSCA